jgi:hypothetical protein
VAEIPLSLDPSPGPGRAGKDSGKGSEECMLELKIKLGGGHDSSSLFELAGLVVGCTSIPQRYSYSHKGTSKWTQSLTD